jgi:hypothetical protein
VKHLKSSLSDMRALFARSVTARHLAEPLVSFDATSDATATRAFMERRDFDEVGVRIDGTTRAYVRREDLQDGTLERFSHSFGGTRDVVDEHDTLTTVLERLVDQPIAYVRMMGQVSGIITKGDLQKAPVRMWLFGLVSLLEMHFLRIIRARFEADGWTGLLSPNRVAKAQELLEDRMRRNEAIDLADCLQLSDKAMIVASVPELCGQLGLGAKEPTKRLLREITTLRDQLAHAHDIVTGRWPRLAGLAREIEALVESSEQCA